MSQPAWGEKGKVPIRKPGDLNEVMTKGAHWAVNNGFGVPEDVLLTEEEGAIGGADPEYVGQRARERGTPQLGTLGPATTSSK